MTRICITGGPRTGKTTLAEALMVAGPYGAPSEGFAVRELPAPVRHTDDLIHLGWSEVSERVAKCWLTQPGPWIIEGVAVARALRKWHDAHPDEPPPVDRLIYLETPHEPLSKGQQAMAKGVATVHAELEPWLFEHGITTEYR